MATIENLSVDILQIVFAHIPMQDVPNVASVCKMWNSVYTLTSCESTPLLEMYEFNVENAFRAAMRNRKISTMQNIRRIYHTPKIIFDILIYIIPTRWEINYIMQVLEILYQDDIIADYNESDILHFFATHLSATIHEEDYDFYYSLIKFLIDHGADPAHNDSIILQYFCIKYKINREMVTMLVDNGADLQLRGHRFLMTHILSGNSDLTNIQILIDIGVDVNANNGRPLELAVDFDNIVYAMEVTTLLLENGANPTLNGNMALVKALDNGFDEDIIQRMIDIGLELVA